MKAIECGVECDSTITGIGRGPGNAKTEELILEKNTDHFNCKIIISILYLKIINEKFLPMKNKYSWGTNIFYYLAVNILFILYIKQCLKIIDIKKKIS